MDVTDHLGTNGGGMIESARSTLEWCWNGVFSWCENYVEKKVSGGGWTGMCEEFNLP
jgi:hypothetical protein